MQKFSTWMILLMDIIFWLLRVVVAYTYAMGIEFMIVPMDLYTEIAVIFISLLAFILIAKRKFLGAIIYIIAHFGYFGATLWNNVMQMSTKSGMVNDYITVFISFIGILLPIFTLLDLLLDKNRQLHPTDKKTDWFYTNKQFDRDKDDREDKNNYRTL